MSELTLKAIEQLLDVKLDENFDAKLKPIKTGMADLATREEIKPIQTRLDGIQKTLDQHTTALDAIATDVRTLLDEKIISAQRFERLEHWAQLVGEKLGIKLEI